MRIVVSIHEPPYWMIPPSEVDRIARALPDDEVVDARDAEARRRAFPGADVLFTWRISAAEFAVAPTVRWLHSSGVGVDPLLQPAVVESPAVVTMSRGIHSESIAEHAIALVLALRRQFHRAGASQARREWAQAELSRASVPPLARTRMLVVGLGSIGGRIAEHGVALGMKVSGVRRRPALPPPAGVDTVVAPGDLRTSLPEADVVVLALPHTAATGAIIGRAELGLMKPTALLVNVARGQLVDEPALIEALEHRRIGGAGLDAFAREPLAPESPFWSLPNALITPHTASFAGDYWTPVVDLFLENVSRFRRGAPLLNVVDKAVGY
jgi:phosphoglycerate dehydrogenase-like enzyme